MQVALSAIGFGLLGYLCNSLLFAIWITRLVKGVDVRAAGSGLANPTNTFRQVGFLPGANHPGCDQGLRSHLFGAALHIGCLDLRVDSHPGSGRALLAALSRLQPNPE
jgi:hypothetical protein